MVSDVKSGVPKHLTKRVTRLAILLRLAVLLNRSRTYEFPDMLKIDAQGRSIKLHLPSDWLQANPLTLADIETEQDYLRSFEFELELVTEDC